jgi:hypothetical protein
LPTLSSGFSVADSELDPLGNYPRRAAPFTVWAPGNFCKPDKIVPFLTEKDRGFGGVSLFNLVE